MSDRRSRRVVASTGGQLPSVIARLGGVACLVGVASLAVVAGCGRQADVGRVVGEVTLDGQPLPAGQVRFLSVDGQAPTAGATIEAGKFTTNLPPGVVRVEISAPRPVAAQRMYDGQLGPAATTSDELLPPRYNIASELTLTVGPGEQQARFELTSDSGKKK